VYFENSLCLSCGSALGFDRESLDLVALEPTETGLVAIDGSRREYRVCGNQQIARCNWLLRADESGTLCASCRLTSVRPHDDDVDALEAFADAEAAKRRLLHQLAVVGLPIVDRVADPQSGLTFEFLSSRGDAVTTGHESGVVTLDLSESDDAHREFVRQQLGEQYRTVLGHLRHEIGHYFWPRLVAADEGALAEFRALFGDDRAPYGHALESHYAAGAPGGWESSHVSQYATMHPWEDWAETFAHYLHIHGGLETAAAFGLTVGEPARSAGLSAWQAPGAVAIGEIVGQWLALTFALNAMSRSIGHGDLYPFVLSPTVVEKLDFVHRMVAAHVNR
jgi:hypothetical protein